MGADAATGAEAGAAPSGTSAVRTARRVTAGVWTARPNAARITASAERTTRAAETASPDAAVVGSSGGDVANAVADFISSAVRAASSSAAAA
jgi:hypothetical protein